MRNSKRGFDVYAVLGLIWFSIGVCLFFGAGWYMIFPGLLVSWAALVLNGG